MVRGLANELPAGVDMSKAKAWIVWDGTTNAIKSSYNIKTLTNKATGDNEIQTAIPFKAPNFAILGTAAKNSSTFGFMLLSTAPSNQGIDKQRDIVRIANVSSSGSTFNSDYNSVAVFGELENE